MLVLGDDTATFPGIKTREPVFGLPATWVPQEFRHQAEVTGATVVDRASVITTHLAEVVRRNAGRLLGRQDVKMLIDVVKQTDPVVIDELNGANVTTGEIQRVLAAAARRRRRHPRPRPHLRSRCRSARASRRTRSRSSRPCAPRSVPRSRPQHAKDGKLPVLTLDPLVEHALAETLRSGDHGTYLAIDPQTAEQLALAVAREAETAEMKGIEPVLVCATQLRPSLRRLLHAAAPRLPVLAYTELGQQLELETIGVVNLGQPAAV